MGAANQPLPFGKYVLLDRIATGGMAEIYRAKYRAEGGFEKTLVIKRILPHLAQDEEFINMFRDEARLTVRLSHANIVQVFDFGKTGEDYFLAMEYVQGQNLRQVMKRCQELGAPVPIPFALFATNEIAKGLNYAHSRKDESDTDMGIVHRDITPSNVLVSYEGEIKIADFGIAKAASRASGTQAGMIKGKASYLAPEQVFGKTLDGRSDLFALGAVLSEMLVGRKLFTGDSDFEIMSKITEAPIPIPSALNAAIPAEIDRVVMKALERDRDRRYLSAGAFQKDLTQLMTQFGGNVTTVDISQFLRRLFRKEVEAEREASKSFRMPVFDEAQITKAAADGATMIASGKGTRSGSEQLPALKEPPRRLSPAAIAVGFVAILAAGMGVGKLALDASKPKDVVVARATPYETIASADPSSTPPPSDDITVRTATPRTTPRTGAASARPFETRVAIAPTPAPRVSATGILKLDSQPWAEISVDGKPIGRQTPAFDVRLPVGRHEIRLWNPVQKLGATFVVVVDASVPVKKVVKLEPGK